MGEYSNIFSSLPCYFLSVAPTLGLRFCATHVIDRVTSTSCSRRVHCSRAEQRTHTAARRCSHSSCCCQSSSSYVFSSLPFIYIFYFPSLCENGCKQPCTIAMAQSFWTPKFAPCKQPCVCKHFGVLPHAVAVLEGRRQSVRARRGCRPFSSNVTIISARGYGPTS